MKKQRVAFLLVLITLLLTACGQGDELKNVDWEKNDDGSLEREKIFNKDDQTTNHYLEEVQGTWIDEEDNSGFGVEVTDNNIYFIVNNDEKIEVDDYYLKVGETKYNESAEAARLRTFYLDSATDYVVENINPSIEEVGVDLNKEGTEIFGMFITDLGGFSSQNFDVFNLSKTNKEFDTQESDVSNNDEMQEFEEPDSSEEMYEDDEMADDPYQTELEDFISGFEDSSSDYSLIAENGRIVIYFILDEENRTEGDEEKIKEYIDITKTVSEEVTDTVGEGITVSLQEPFEHDYSVSFVDGSPTTSNETYQNVLEEMNLN
ncbi:hypothetical protein GCM10025886_02340 [Tetragenococcus halophilus subsp. flandriensis]|uniref:hypothetical protein n=1 Tax=Tetragenococcus halophilus TaxID=51669 RepID=UPI0023EA176B|nr:hypothetical protein [Tetragenococcus halophilus]GMA07083.1 hypothetical protein GCM10025886_02340 [Tetragenococcus halophilus subsp. flandriensis]